MNNIINIYIFLVIVKMGTGSSKKSEINVKMKGSDEHEKRVQDDDKNTANATAQDIEKMKQQAKELEEEIKTEKDPNIKRQKTITMLKIYITLYPDVVMSRC